MRVQKAVLLLLGVALGAGGSERAIAQLGLSGSLLLVQEGPAAAVAGDPVPLNLALDGTAFASSELGPEIGAAYHFIDNLNDGAYGNGFSWIGGDDNPFFEPFAGIDLGAVPVANVQSIAFGRSNVLTGDPCGGGVCTDRHLGFYSLQYTQFPNPSTELDLDLTGNPSTGWVEIGTLDYGDSDGPDTNYNRTWLRHRYNFDPVNATGVRLVVPGTGLGGGTAIDEIELYNTPGEFVPPPPPPPPFAINPAEGFRIAWDGNDGDFFDEEAPPFGAVVPDNLALADRGSVAFASSELGPQLGIDFHLIDNLNDGFYGNTNSWIGGDDNPFDPDAFAGIRLPEATAIDRVAWGRDNGNTLTDACGGTCVDRSLGEYTLQFTLVADPDESTQDTGDASTGWQTLGTLTYQTATDEFTPHLRHEFEIGRENGALVATGIRLLVPFNGLGGGTAIDEIEIYGAAAGVPGDFDGDGDCDVDDIDILAGAIRGGSMDSVYDLNGDSTVDSADHRFMISDLKNTWLGDANLDGEFSSNDFVAVFQVGEYEDTVAGNSGWADGDWNGDGDFNSSDFVAAFSDGGFEQGPRGAVAAVPEPAGLLMLTLGLLSLTGRIRCHRIARNARER